MSDARETFLSAVDLVTAQVDSLSPADWRQNSPCEGWDARHVLVHVTGTLSKVLEMVDDGTYAGQPSSVADAPEPADAVAAWHDVAAAVRPAVLDAPLDAVAETPRGPQRLAGALALPTADCAVHAWDIATAAGRHLELPDDLARHTDELSRSVPEEQLRQMFAPAQQAAADATPTQRLMAWLGRDTRYR